MIRFVVLHLCLLLPAAAQPKTQRQQLLDRMAEIPDEAWPRGAGHVVLAWPGSSLEQKGYHEPGGSFSPAPGSFGLQWLVRGPDGNILTTSDTFPLDQLKQRWTFTGPAPAIETTTPYYRVVWAATEPGRFTATVTPLAKPGNRLILNLRSAGPAGGPLRSVRHKGFAITINDRWVLTIPKNTEGVQILAAPDDDWTGGEITLPAKGEWVLAIADTRPAPQSPFPAWENQLSASLPDPRFLDSLRAQVAHLKAGLTGVETRPGEPVNYPLAWLRDGAYSLTALAMAGELQTARALSTLFAERDFFGGFGPEADAPGLALWALEEVALRLRDPQYDQFLWPHAVRKAEFILTMLATTEPLRGIAFGPIVPRHLNDPNLTLICDPAKDGLIQGRMDHHRPLLFVNAVSYRGLRSAAELAARVGDPARAERWNKAAAALQTAWWKAFDIDKERDNERTAISGLWPAGIAASEPARYQTAVPSAMKPDPLWTYFDVARAHQYVRLGNAAAARQTLGWFWDHQASPGLFSWWEGNGEENTFGLWNNIRGWVKPPHVTPHYWTAAEMLALQLEMLVWVDDSTDPPQLVIGAGIPPDWAKRPLEARGILTRLGRVDWSWKAGKLTVLLDGKPTTTPIRPSPALGRP